MRNNFTNARENISSGKGKENEDSNSPYDQHRQPASERDTKASLFGNGKTPKINNTRSISNASSVGNSTIATINSTTSASNNRSLPGIFVLMDQNNWKRVAERAKKYRKECRVTAYVKRTLHLPPSQCDPRDGLGGAGAGVGSLRTRGVGQQHESFNTLDSNQSNSSQKTDHVSNASNFNPKTHVKCKALHHACHRLRRVHGHIRKRIAESLRHEQIYAAYNPSPVISPTVIQSSLPSISSSFDSSDDGQHLNSLSASGPFDPFGFNSKSRGNRKMKWNRNHQNAQDDVEEWDDPWIEACKAILAIIEQYPEAAGQRESRHGCLPIHLAVFAMCPTPDVPSVAEMCDLGDGVDVYSNLNLEHHNNHNHHHAGSKQQAFAMSNEMPPPPRPLSRARRHSNSSAGSSAGTQSLDEFSAAMDRESPLNTGSGTIGSHSITSSSGVSSYASSTSRGRGLSQTLEKLEAQLRSSPQSKLTEEDEATMLESARLMSVESSSRATGCGLSRPSPLGSYNTSSGTSDSLRSTSIGSQTSNCSSSVISAASFASSIYSNVQSPKHNLFNLKKYIANEARREEYSLRVLNALLDAFPRGVKVDSEGGRLPLHTAVAGKATLKIIETIIRAYPHACRHRNNENSLPLHIAASYGVSDPNVAPCLLRVYPDASVGKNRWERTPFEEALLTAGINGRPHQEELCRALRRPPAFWSNVAQSFQARAGFFNQNFASGAGNIDHLLNGEFTSGADRGEDNNSKADKVDVRNLFALIKERQWDFIVENIDVLQPQASKRFVCEVRGGYDAEVSSLYVACEQEPTYEVLDALVNACPGSTSWRKLPGGEMPLHAACTYGASKAVVGFLLAASPDTARQRDNLGNLPLHCACFSGASESIIESLLCTNPKAANARNVQGSTPRDIVRRLAHSNRKEILDLIENVSLELLKKKRQYDNQKQIHQRKAQLESMENKDSNCEGNENSTIKSRKFFGKSRKKSKELETLQPMATERKMNITRAPPPEEEIEIELADEINDGMLWV